jgi:gliding motility-associated protein GldM
MAHGKETPRQKMIGMMYLVLTALLALNVSREILEAFVIVDKGLNKTTKNFAEKNKAIYKDFEKSAILNEAKTKKWKDYAFEVKQHADALTALIQDDKIKIVVKAEGPKNKAVKGDEIDGVEITSKDNTAEPMQVMLGNNNDGEAIKLKAGIKNFKQFIYSIEGIDKAESLKASIEKELDIENPPPTKLKDKKLTWEEAHFEELPLIAVLTIMSSLQANIRNAEADLLTYLYSQIDKNDIKFNELNSVVIPKTDYVVRGDQFEAQLFIGAFDTTKNPKILIGNVEEKRLADGSIDYVMKGSYDSVRVFQDGRGIWKAPTSAPGEKNFDGLIVLKAPGGNDIKKPFHTKYSVNPPMVTVSPTKMNVFYRGVDNPIDVAASGFSAEKISITFTNGLVKKVGGSSYVINPTKIGEGQPVTVYVVDIDGKKKVMGNVPFRVKDLPDPIAMVGGKKYGNVDKSWLTLQTKVTAALDQSDFEYPFTVIEFTVSAVIGGFSAEKASKNNLITDDQIKVIKSAGRGSRVHFDDIKVIGPAGSARTLQSLTFKLN